MLKVRTDRSYEALARRVGVSRSTLHRNCRGEVVPGLDVVVRFARVCGATKQEAEDLVRYWALAADQRPDPAPRGDADLVPLLADVVRRGPVATRFSVTGPAPVAAVAAAAICRSVGEALRNVAQHAGVAGATVLVGYDDGRVVVEVVDDGRGFDPGAVPAHRRGTALSLVDRMAAVGGRAALTARPGRGTRVRLEWPDG